SRLWTSPDRQQVQCRFGSNHFIDSIHFARSAAGYDHQSTASFSRVCFSLSRQDFSLSLVCPAYPTEEAPRQLAVTFQLGMLSAVAINNVKGSARTGISIATPELGFSSKCLRLR